MQKITGHKDLIVWQKAMDLVVDTYALTDTFPQKEQYGLSSQMRRSAVSIPSNIAEGYHRSTTKEYRNFLQIAYGSASELDTQIEICIRTNIISSDDVASIRELLVEVLKMLNVLIKKIGNNPTTPYALRPTP
jgi:four helix bundle protein